jgi:hypothetical protein
MKKAFLNIITAGYLLLFTLTAGVAQAQEKAQQALAVVAPTSSNLGINTTTPHASAVLDVTSTTQGVLVPRMTQAQRNAITSPATGLMIFQTDNTPGFYYYNGTAWTAVGGQVITATTVLRNAVSTQSPGYTLAYTSTYSLNFLTGLSFMLPANTTMTFDVYSFDDESITYQVLSVTPTTTNSGWTVNTTPLASVEVPASTSGSAQTGTLSYTNTASTPQVYTLFISKTGGGSFTTSSVHYTTFRTN